jgi:hypothetical protein
LFLAIPNRHTNRGPYRADQPIGRERLQRFADLTSSEAVRVIFVEDAHARAELGAMIVEATERIVSDRQMSADSARWFRTGRRDIEAHHDGVTIDTSGVSPLIAAVSKLLPDLDAKSADQYWASMTRDMHVATAPVLGVIRSRSAQHARRDRGRSRVAKATVLVDHWFRARRHRQAGDFHHLWRVVVDRQGCTARRGNTASGLRSRNRLSSLAASHLVLASQLS